MNDRSIQLDGARIRCWDSGGQGPAVLMTHGIGESLEFWHTQFEAFGLQMRLLAWDMPGHSRSDEMPRPCPWKDRPPSPGSCWTSWACRTCT